MRFLIKFMLLVPVFSYAQIGVIDLYPGNDDRERRANELINDVNRTLVDTDVILIEIAEVSEQIEEQHNRLYQKANLPTPSEMQQPLSLPYSDIFSDISEFNLALGKTISTALGYQAEQALTRSISRYLFKKNLVSLGQAGLSKIIAVPATTRFINIKGLAPAGAGFAFSTVLDLGFRTISDAIVGAERRDALREVIDESFMTRREVYKEFLVKDKVRESLAVYLYTLKSILSLNLPHQSNLIAKQQIELNLQQSMQDILMYEVDAYLELLDQNRASWTNGDPQL